MKYFIIGLFQFCFLANAQLGNGFDGFQFINGFYSARSIGTGNNLISVIDNDLVLTSENPALLNSKMYNQLAVNQSLLPTGVNFGSIQYAFKSKVGIFSPIIKYVNYGGFTETDEVGHVLGKFSSLDYSVGMLYSREFSPVISIGVGLNLLGSHLESYSGYGFSTTISALYKHPNQLFSVAFLAKGIGISFKNYTSNEKTSLPMDVQASLTYKLKHAPFRFSLLAKQLNQWDIVYRDPNEKPSYDALTGDTIPVKIPGFVGEACESSEFASRINCFKVIAFSHGF